MDKDYANGLYYEDFSDVKERMDKEFKAYVLKDVEALIEGEYFFTVDVQLYNLGYIT